MSDTNFIIKGAGMAFHKWNKPLIVLLVCIILSGCTHLRDLTPSEFRVQRYYYKTVNLNKSLKELSDMLVVYNNNCKLAPGIVINPDQLSGSIVWRIGGFLDLATMAVMDFKEVSKNNTEIKIWAAEMWRNPPDAVLKILENSGKCP